VPATMHSSLFWFRF